MSLPLQAKDYLEKHKSRVSYYEEFDIHASHFICGLFAR